MTNTKLALDCLSEAVSAVLLCICAVEAFANALIDELSQDAEVIVRRGGEKVSVPQDKMVRNLGLGDKIALVPPLLSGNPTIRGTSAWESFLHLRHLRDDLVHVKGHGYSADPDDPSPFGRLLRGDATDCVEETTRLIDACSPDWLSERFRKWLTT